MCICFFAPPVCLLIHCYAILAKKAAISVVFIDHSWGSFYCSFHVVVPINLTYLFHLFLDFGMRFLD
jgi:hypothetical protein